MQDSTASGGQLAAEALARAGVGTLFALPGSHVARTLEAAPGAGIRVISTRHEESAVMMAEGWSLATGQVGVAMVTAGPGLANAMGGIAEANAASAPVVVIAGRTALARRGRGAVQDLGQLELVAPISKWRGECLIPERIPEYVAEALRQARWGCPGLAYLEIPEDVLAAFVSGVPPADPEFPVSRPVPDPGSVAASVELMAGARRPLILAGSGAFFSGAGEALRRLAERTGIPVTTTSAARGLLDDSHPLCLGSLVHGGAVLAGADLALVLGSRFNANLVYGGLPLFNEDQTLIQVDLVAEHMGGPRAPRLGLTGDVAATLDRLTEAWQEPPEKFAAWAEEARNTAATSWDMWSSEADSPTAQLHPGWLAREAAAVFEANGGGTWVSDGGDSVPWGIAFSKAHRPGSNMLIGSAMGTLGVGLPFAIAAALARPESPVFLFSGDGAFGFSAMELHTASRHHLPLVVLVVNNGVWRGPGSQPRVEGDSFSYRALAEAARIGAETVNSQAELAPAVERALAAARAGGPYLIDAAADPKVVSNLMRGMDSLGLM